MAEDLKNYHKSQLDHLKMHTIGFNIFRKSENFIVLIEPLFILKTQGIPKPDLLAIEKRKNKKMLFFHWIEVKGNISDREYKDNLSRLKKIKEHFESDIFLFLSNTYPKLLGLFKDIKVKKDMSNYIYHDYTLLFPAIYLTDIKHNTKNLTIPTFVVDSEKSMVRLIFNQKDTNTYWTQKFAKKVEKMTGLSEPVIFTPSYPYSLLMTDITYIFYENFQEDVNFKKMFKRMLNTERRSYFRDKVSEHLTMKYNYPKDLADAYSDITLQIFLKNGIINKKRKMVIKKSSSKREKTEILRIDKKVENILINEHIDKYSFFIDYLSSKGIQTTEIGNSDLRGTLNYYLTNIN